MKLLSYPFYTFYRIWFYILASLPIVVLFPFYALSLSRTEWFPYAFRLAKFWADFVLVGMGLIPNVEGRKNLQKGKSYIYTPNHVSILDIMMVLSLAKSPFVFVAKAELAKIPVFGYIFKRACILVDRSSLQSRKAVYSQVEERISQGYGICVFPEGGVPPEEVVLDKFKDGAFKMAIEHSIPILPMVFLDNKKLFSFTFLSGSPGVARVKIFSKIETNNYSLSQVKGLKDKVRNIILNEL